MCVCGAVRGEQLTVRETAALDRGICGVAHLHLHSPHTLDTPSPKPSTTIHPQTHSCHHFPHPTHTHTASIPPTTIHTATHPSHQLPLNPTHSFHTCIPICTPRSLPSPTEDVAPTHRLTVWVDVGDVSGSVGWSRIVGG